MGGDGSVSSCGSDIQFFFEVAHITKEQLSLEASCTCSRGFPCGKGKLTRQVSSPPLRQEGFHSGLPYSRVQHTPAQTQVIRNRSAPSAPSPVRMRSQAEVAEVAPLGACGCLSRLKSRPERRSMQFGVWRWQAARKSGQRKPAPCPMRVESSPPARPPTPINGSPRPNGSRLQKSSSGLDWKITHRRPLPTHALGSTPLVRGRGSRLPRPFRLSLHELLRLMNE